MRKKAALLTSALVFCCVLAVAQPSQDMPHRVFGTVEDTQGNAVADAEVEMVFEGENLASDTTTDEDGYYDITVPYSKDFSGEEVQIQVDGSQADTFVYSSGEVEERDLVVDTSQEQENREEQDTPSDGGGGGGAGAFQSDEEQEENSDNTTTNNTENTTEGKLTEDDTETHSENTDSTDSTNTSETDNQQDNSTETANSITGMFSSSTSAVGEIITGFFSRLVSAVTNLFG